MPRNRWRIERGRRKNKKAATLGVFKPPTVIETVWQDDDNALSQPFDTTTVLSCLTPTHAQYARRFYRVQAARTVARPG
jgi:hypothetical protein